jgi:hypothetical protein
VCIIRDWSYKCTSGCVILSSTFPIRQTQFRLLFIITICAAGLNAQIQFLDPQQGGPAMLNSDLAALETNGTRKDFGCALDQIRAFPGFDLRLHAGYSFTVPARELAGQAGYLEALFRVAPRDPQGEPVYFLQRAPIDSNLKKGLPIQGIFDVGPGRYRVDWLLHDTRGRACVFHWDLNVKPRREHGAEFGLPNGVVRGSGNNLFGPAAPVSRVQYGGMHPVVLVNMAPQDDGQTMLDQSHLAALVLMLRDIGREPRFTSFSLTAFQLKNMRVIYRQQNGSQIDFPALGKAMESRQTGTISIRQLGRRHGPREFLTGLIAKTMRSEKPDILIFVGVKAMLDGRLVLDASSVPRPGYPVVYLNYNSDPVGNPWQDVIGDAVKFFGGHIYTISRAADLWTAWQSVLQIADQRRPGRVMASLGQGSWSGSAK